MPLIDEMYAFVATESEGEEGIIGAEINGNMMPLIGADKARMKSLAPLAKHIAELTDTPYRLVKFHQIETIDIEEFLK